MWTGQICPKSTLNIVLNTTNTTNTANKHIIITKYETYNNFIKEHDAKIIKRDELLELISNIETNIETNIKIDKEIKQLDAELVNINSVYESLTNTNANQDTIEYTNLQQRRRQSTNL